MKVARRSDDKKTMHDDSPTRRPPRIETQPLPENENAQQSARCARRPRRRALARNAPRPLLRTNEPDKKPVSKKRKS